MTYSTTETIHGYRVTCAGRTIAQLRACIDRHRRLDPETVRKIAAAQAHLRHTKSRHEEALKRRAAFRVV